MAKEAYDDMQRYNRDKVINEKLYRKIDPLTGLTVEAISKDLRVGDIVYVNSNERVPADIVLLYTTDKQGSVFIKTDQLDGETDWKVRRPISFTQHHLELPEDLLYFNNAEVKCEGPTNLIYEFNALFSVEDNR